MRPKYAAFLTFGLAGLLIFVLGGCQSMPKRINPEEELRARVEAYWQAKSDKDLITAYEFFTPEFREKVSLQAYLQAHTLVLKGWRLEELEVLPSGDEGRTLIQTTMQVMGFTFENIPQEQAWIKLDGTWYVQAKTPRESMEELFGTRGKGQGS